MGKIRKLNELFDNDDHHDSHEFLNWILNEIHEKAIADYKSVKGAAPKSTFISEFFGGQLVSITTCLTCEQRGRMNESFFDLSLDIS